MEFIKVTQLSYSKREMINSIKIIVPTLNSYLILPKLIESLEKQTWKGWNLLFIDGKSNKMHKEWLRKICSNDLRFNFIEENDEFRGIFGAMNQGLNKIEDDEWVLFWGSDDWASSPTSLEYLVKRINNLSKKYDLIVCRGKYIKENTNKIVRQSIFFNNKKSIILNAKKYRNKLFLGYIPPHQSTLFNKRIFDNFSIFSQDFQLAADLDYFLRFSIMPNISILVLNNQLVNMSSGGVSSKKNRLRFKEVIYAYKKSFGILFFVPFILRYIRRFFSIIK